MITEDSIALVRDVPVEAIAALYTKITKGKGCCPIHNEKTPSFSVKRDFFKCFGCGAGGDGLKLVQIMEHTDFIGSVEYIAQQFNIALEYSKSYDKEAFEKARAEKKSLRDMMNEAHAKYQQLLVHETIGARARSYLYDAPQRNEEIGRIWGRGYNEDIAAKWGLGFAPDEWRTLSGDYVKNGLLPQAIKLGLSKEKDNGSAYDFYRNRIIIPITDERGELLTFAGLTLGKITKYNAKYLNGPQTPLYNKSATLFGLYQAEKGIKKLGYAILTEGYTDVISMHAAGAVNTVASCGSKNLTEEHCLLLKEYTRHVLIMRDGDKAGMEAITNDMQLLLEKGFKVDVMIMKPGTDPDDMARPFFEQAEKKQPAKPAGWSIKCVTKPATGQWHFIK